MKVQGNRPFQWVLLIPFLIISWAFSQAYLDGRDILELINASRYEDAQALAQRAPEKYAQWVGLLLAQRLLPETQTSNSFEAAAKGAEYACRYARVNKESEAVCYYLLRFLFTWKDRDPRATKALSQASVPTLSLAETGERLESLAREGVPFAVLRTVQNDENGLRELMQRFPYSLGGASATARLSLFLWEKEQYPEAVSVALKVAGFSGTSGGIVAYGEYYGIGVKRDSEAACRRSLFWAKRNATGTALYTLALCYMEGAGGFPRDLPLAYGLFWVGKEYSRYPHFAARIQELEKVLTPDQLKEGRRRASEFYFQ